MAGTYAFETKDAFVALLKADTNLLALMDTEAISYGFPEIGGGIRPRLSITVGDIEWDDEVSIALGAQHRDEFFRIIMTVESFYPGDTQVVANNRVKDVMKIIEALVRNPRWSGLPLVLSQLKPQLLSEGPGDDGRAAILVMSLHVQARKS